MTQAKKKFKVKTDITSQKFERAFGIFNTKNISKFLHHFYFDE